jgi:hypothetical protein
VSALASVTSPPNNVNPNNPGDTPASVGSHVALTGSANSETAGTAGICQTFTVNSVNKYLSFWAWEGGTEYKYSYGDQEADILDSTGTTLQQTLFAETNCFFDARSGGLAAFPQGNGSTTQGCTPNQTTYGCCAGTSTYVDWQGGYWVQRGPYDLTSYVGQTVTLFIGVWDESTSAGPSNYFNLMFIGNVQLTSTNAFPSIVRLKNAGHQRPSAHTNKPPTRPGGGR